jgi:hypothetical protein
MSKTNNKTTQRHVPKWDDPLPTMNPLTLQLLDMLFKPKSSSIDSNGDPIKPKTTPSGLPSPELSDHRLKNLQDFEFLYQAIVFDKDSWSKIEELKKVVMQLSLMCAAAKRKTAPLAAKPPAVTSSNPKDLETLNKMKQKLELSKKRARERFIDKTPKEEELRKSQKTEKEQKPPLSDLAKEYDDGEEDSQDEASDFDFLATKD